MLRQAPGIEEDVVPFCLYFRDTVCSYNAGFDMGFITHELSRMQKVFPEDVVVVDAMARRSCRDCRVCIVVCRRAAGDRDPTAASGFPMYY